jgi:hypothetical protein
MIRRVVRGLVRGLVLGMICASWICAARASAQPAGGEVALLPLDADRSLEIYGQPVASEIARALVAAKVLVVVVGPKMAVPEGALLIVDGTIAPGKASAVTISLRIRSALDGLVLEALSATAPGLAKIDGAAADLSARALPLIKEHLATIRKGLTAPPGEHGAIHATAPPRSPTAEPLLLVAVADRRRDAPHDPLLGALKTAVDAWARAAHREPRTIDASQLDAKRAAPAVRASGAGLALGFWIVGYTEEAGALPMARARVRVQITDATAVVFDRVVVTDTVLGDKGLAPAELAARVAREILAIVRPHLVRSVPAWR